MKFLTVVLAGGEGSRMGGGKPLRMLGEETLITRAVRLARSWSGDVVLALREPLQAGEHGLPILLDDPDVWGPLAGLSSALSAAQERGHSHVLTLPCDMPFLPSDLPHRLAHEGGKGVALASSDGQLHPVCGLWPVSVSDRIPAYVAAGRRSLKGLAESVGMTAVDWPGACFVNVNDPDELAAAELRLALEFQDVNHRAGG